MINRIRQAATSLLGSSIFRDSSQLALANYASTALSVITSVIVARVLGDVRYGLILLAIRIVTVIVQFMDIRTQEGLIKFMSAALTHNDRRKALTFFIVGLSIDLLLALVTFGIVALLAPLATGVYAEQADLRSLVMIFMFSVPFTTLQSSFSTLAHIFKRFDLFAVGIILGALILMVALLVMLPHGLTAMMWGYVLADGLTFLMWLVMGLWLLVRHLQPSRDLLRGADFRGAGREFLPFAFHTSITQSIKAIATNIDTLVLGALLPVSAVAQYSIAWSAASLIGLITAPAGQVIYRDMTDAWAHEQIDRVRRLVGRYMLIASAIGITAVGFYTVAGRLLVRLFYGPKYFDVAELIAQLIVVLGVGIVLESVFRWVRPATLAAGQPQLATFYSVAQVAMRLVLLVPMVFVLGALGAALTYDIVVMLTLLLVGFYVLPRLDLWHPFQ